MLAHQIFGVLGLLLQGLLNGLCLLRIALLFVLVPTLAASLYVSFRQVFAQDDQPAPADE